MHFVQIVGCGGSVLIDTWWNVNMDDPSELVDCLPVLIDTWWNVNPFSIFMKIGKQICFNRYMVECECYKYYWLAHYP